MIVLSTYTWLAESLQRRTVTNPSESEYLQLEKNYPNSLSCPCRSVNHMSYSNFTTIEPYHHQLCSSDLITPQWIAYSYSGISSTNYYFDYRVHATAQFATLAMFCALARQTIHDSAQSFLQTGLINSQVVRKELFERQMYSLVADWNVTTRNQFVRAIQLIRNTTNANQLLNRLNIFFFFDYAPDMVGIGPRDYGGCFCAFRWDCRSPMSIFSYDIPTNTRTVDFLIPNFFLGCYLVDALMMSTLECFYDRSCMLGIDQYLNPSLRWSVKFPALDATLNSPNETIESIINRLMVDSWSSNVNFSSYYQACAPSSCTFEYRGRNELFFVITTIIGIIGGLSLGSKLFIFIGLLIIQKIANGISLALFIELRGGFFSWSNEQQKMKRLHVILVAVTLFGLYSTMTFTPKLITIETEKPSLSVYQNLMEQYSGSVQCSCSQISIKYQSFLTLAASFHPVCRDNFIDRYMSYTSIYGALIYSVLSRDYVYSGHGQLLAVDFLCEISQQVVNDSFAQLLTNDFINTQLLSSDQLHGQIQRRVSDFRTAMPKSTINTFSLIRETTSANMFMNTLSNSWVFARTNRTDGSTVHTVPVVYSGCTCGLSAKCSEPIHEVRYGCYVIEALLQSTLAPFYESTRFGLTLTFPSLNASLHPTRFGINATIESIFKELMIEQFSNSISYENFFAKCAPSSCFSSYTGKSNIIEGMTLLISLYGGLVIICRVIAMMIVKVLRRLDNKIHPTNH